MKVSKKNLKKKCDELWSLIIKSGGACEICGQSVRDPHHVIGRINYILRWDLRNGVRLCFQHHTGGKLSAHNDPIWFMDWFKSKRSDDYEYLLTKKNDVKTFNILDYQEILQKLKEEYAQLETTKT